MSELEAEISQMSTNSIQSGVSERASGTFSRRQSFRSKRRHKDNRTDVDDWGKTEAEQDAAVDAFKRFMIAEGIVSKFGDGKLNDKHKLLRFLRAREYDNAKACEMYFNHLAWREQEGVDTILQDFQFKEREAFLGVYPQGYYKTDKTGRPVSIQHLGSIDLKKIKEVTTMERMVKFHIQEYERFLSQIAPVCSRVAGRHIDQTFAILDVKGVTLRMLTGDVRKMLAEITKIDQDHYPETLGKTCIINAPFVFKAVWSIVKPMLQPRTVAKISLLGHKYIDELAQYIDLDNIPTYLGGRSKNTLLDDAGPWNDPKVLSSLNKIDEGALASDRPQDGAAAGDVDAAGPSPLVRTAIVARPDALPNAYQDLMFEARSAERVAASGPPRINAASEPLPSAVRGGGQQIRAAADTPPQSPNLARRLQALEKRIRSMQGGPAAMDQPRATGRGLLGRVDQLEHAMCTLLDAQEARMAGGGMSSNPDSSQADAPHGAPDAVPKSGCCGCCIM